MDRSETAEQIQTSCTDTKDQTKCTGIEDVDIDSLIQCACNLELHDLANMAMTCRHFRDVAYSDPVWELQCSIVHCCSKCFRNPYFLLPQHFQRPLRTHKFWGLLYLGRKRWLPKQMSGGILQYSGGREAYLARYVAAQQFKFVDPVDFQFHVSHAPISHILLDDDNIIIAQGSHIFKWKIGILEEPPSISQTLHDHNARITCMRLFSLEGIGSFRNVADGRNKVLVTSSCDHTIRIWGKGRSLRTFRGHSGPVTVLGDHLLGDCGAPILASGGADGTVRLWSLSSNNTRGRTALKGTLHGHEQSVEALVVAEHNPSLLVSIARDSKLRLWDSTTSPLHASGSCVGSTRGSGVPVGIKCKEAVCYVAGSSSVIAIDLRSMQTVATVAIHRPKLLAFEMSPSGITICTGGSDKTAKLWDIRNNHEVPEPVAVLESHSGPVKSLHIDSYKVITGGPGDKSVHVWDAKTADEIVSLDCGEERILSEVKVGAMAVSGARLVTGSCGELPGIIRFRDFSDCAVPLLTEDQNSESVFKFWETDFSSEV